MKDIYFGDKRMELNVGARNFLVRSARSWR